MLSKTELEKKVFSIKKKCMDMCIKVGIGHITSAFSCAEIMVVLYYDIMKFDIFDPKWYNRDRFIMSKNHGSIITYPILCDLGFIQEKTVSSFLENGSSLGIHSKIGLPGVEFSGGSLGIGFGVAAGMAYSAKINKEEWLTFVLVGDGECYEGSIWETAMFAGHNQLNNLIVIVDRNNMCITDFTENMLKLEPLQDKWKSFNWEVKCINGHDIDDIRNSLNGIRKMKYNKPLCIIADTVKGNGVSFMMNKPLFHGITPKGKEAEKMVMQFMEGDFGG